MELRENYVEIVSPADDPYTIPIKPPLDRNPLLFVIPFFFAILFFVFLLEIDILEFPAFRDTIAKRPSSGVNVDALDGLKGLAAIMVVGHHTYGRFAGLGTSGVWLFMALSGFLWPARLLIVPSWFFLLYKATIRRLS